jgi:hypothetical protein
MPGIERSRRWAAVGAASVVVAAGFGVLTASARTAPARTRQMLKQHVGGARPAPAASAAQKARCVSGVGLFRREHGCKTAMRLVCRKSPGRTVLRAIPSKAYWAGTWHIELAPVSPYWPAKGPPVKGGRLSIRTPLGVRREEAIVSLFSGRPLPTQILVWARCS